MGFISNECGYCRRHALNGIFHHPLRAVFLCTKKAQGKDRKNRNLGILILPCQKWYNDYNVGQVGDLALGNISVSLPSDGSAATVSQYNTPINTIVNEINGSLDNSNIAANAAIDGSKLADGSVTPKKWTNPYRFSAYRASSSSVPNSSTLEPVVYNAVEFDPNSDFDTSTGRYTAPIAGTYYFEAGSYASAVTGDIVYMHLYKNGSRVKYGDRNRNSDGNTQPMFVGVSALLELEAGDYVTVLIGHTQSYSMGLGTSAETNFFHGYLVAETEAA